MSNRNPYDKNLEFCVFNFIKGILLTRAEVITMIKTYNIYSTNDDDPEINKEYDDGYYLSEYLLVDFHKGLSLWDNGTMTGYDQKQYLLGYKFGSVSTLNGYSKGYFEIDESESKSYNITHDIVLNDLSETYDFAKPSKYIIHSRLD